MTVSRCPICECVDLARVIDRPRVPIFQNVVYHSHTEARLAATGDIALSACNGCGFVFNAAFDPLKVKYDPNYENRQTFSDIFLQHINVISSRVLKKLPGKGGTVVDIGCGQGDFLNYLASRTTGQEVALVGFDPSFRDAETRPGVTIVRQLLDRSVVKELAPNCDVLVCRHVIEHIDRPVEFLRTIFRSVPAGRDVTLFIETPCFSWIATNRVLQDVFYEHVNYFTKATLSLALTQAGFTVRSVEHVFGGQYLWAEAVPSDRGCEARPDRFACASGDAASAVEEARRYSAQIEGQLDDWNKVLSDEVPTALWGAGAKGVTFAGLLDPGKELIACIVDVNPKKQGRFIPLSGHPIVAPERAKQYGVHRILVMNSNYLEEIRASMQALDMSATILDAGTARWRSEC